MASTPDPAAGGPGAAPTPSWWRRLRAGALLLLVPVVGIVAIVYLQGDDETRADLLAAPYSVAVRALAAVNGTDPTVYMPSDRNPGFIYIEAPQVFTRERLVNDRFRQSTWLDKELRDTETEEAAARLTAPSRRTRTETDAGLVVGGGGSEDPQAAGGGPDALDLALDSRSVFNAEAELRSDIREAMMDAQLDDSHDLDGNTLYRMTFEAATVPFIGNASYPGSAVIVAEVSKWDAGKDEELAIEDAKELLEDWQKEMQNYFNKIIKLKSASWSQTGTLDNPHDGQEAIAFREFLCRQVRAEVVELTEANYPKDNEALCPDGDEFDHFMDQISERVVEIERALLEIALAYEFNCIDQSAEVLDMPGADRAVLHVLKLELLQSPDGRTGCGTSEIKPEQVLLRLLAVLRAIKQEKVNLQLGALSIDDLTQAIPGKQCIYEWKKFSHRRLVANFGTKVLTAFREVDAGMRVSKLTDQAYYKSQLTRIMTSSPRMGEDFAFPFECSPTSNSIDSDISTRGRFIYLFSSSELAYYATDREYAEFTRQRITGEIKNFFYSDQEELTNFFDVKLHGCDIAKCSIRLVPKFDKGDENKIREAASGLQLFLAKKQNDLTVYSIEPRLQTYNVELNDSQERRLVAQGVGRSGTAAYSRRTDDATAVALAKVIGFSDIAPAGEHASPRETVTFGWIVRPRSAGEHGWMAEHHALSALVAVPSWWKRVKVVVKSCWVTPYHSRRLPAKSLDSDPAGVCSKVEDLSPGPHAAPRDYLVQLPRTIDEVMARFQLDVLKAPYLDFDWLNQEMPFLQLEAGRKGRVVFVGERLWRSTVVTLWDTPADRIEVLPDMRGVIATFDCVPAPPGNPYITRQRKPESTKAGEQATAEDVPPAGAAEPPEDTRAPAVVWTSEGRTQWVGIRVMPFVARTDNDAPCFVNSPSANGGAIAPDDGAEPAPADGAEPAPADGGDVVAGATAADPNR